MQRLSRKNKCEQENLKVTSLSIKPITKVIKKDLTVDMPKKTDSQSEVS